MRAVNFLITASIMSSLFISIVLMSAVITAAAHHQLPSIDTKQEPQNVLSSVLSIEDVSTKTPEEPHLAETRTRPAIGYGHGYRDQYGEFEG